MIWWAQSLEAGGDVQTVIEAFAASEEARSLYGDILPAAIEAVIIQEYNWLFGRDPDDTALSFWVDAFYSGATVGSIIWSMIDGAQGEDLLSVNNKLTAANLFTMTIDPGLDGKRIQATYSRLEDAAAGRNFLSPVTSDVGTIPTQTQTATYIINYIADPGDPILK